jgi:hypothetical protein
MFTKFQFKRNYQMLIKNQKPNTSYKLDKNATIWTNNEKFKSFNILTQNKPLNRNPHLITLGTWLWSHLMQNLLWAFISCVWIFLFIVGKINELLWNYFILDDSISGFDLFLKICGHIIRDHIPFLILCLFFCISILNIGKTI